MAHFIIIGTTCQVCATITCELGNKKLRCLVVGPANLRKTKFEGRVALIPFVRAKNLEVGSDSEIYGIAPTDNRSLLSRTVAGHILPRTKAKLGTGLRFPPEGVSSDLKNKNFQLLAYPTFPENEYHRGLAISLLCSEWEEVGPARLKYQQMKVFIPRRVFPQEADPLLADTSLPAGRQVCSVCPPLAEMGTLLR